MSAQHTPGPWRWFGNRSGGVYLAAAHSGRRYVMGFQRYGMNGAQPTFRVGNIMRPAAELVEFEVGDGTARGFKQADKDGSVYRYDVAGIDCADARLIAAAPDLLTELAEARTTLSILRTQVMTEVNRGIDRWEGVPDKLNERLNAIDAAIAKAGAA